MKAILLGFILVSCTLFGQTQKGASKKTERCKPYASINGLKGAGIIKAKNLAGLKSLEVINECKDGRFYTIMSFDLITVIHKKKGNYPGKYGDLSPEMKKALAKCKAGSTISFSNIRVKSGDGKFENIQGVTLHVK